jgi:hypothetical protein
VGLVRYLRNDPRVRRFHRLEREARTVQAESIQLSIRLSETKRRELSMLNKPEREILKDVIRISYPFRNERERDDAAQAALVGLCKKVRGWRRMEGSRFLKMNPHLNPDSFRFKPYSELPFVYRFLSSRLRTVQDMPGGFLYEFERSGIRRELV